MSENTTRTPDQECPCCHYVMDAHSPLDNGPATPGEGDISICLRCGSFLVFNKDLQLAVAQEKDLDEIKKYPEDYVRMLAAQRLIRLTNYD